MATLAATQAPTQWYNIADDEDDEEEEAIYEAHWFGGTIAYLHEENC